MRIDPKLEPKVREALAGAVAQEPDRFRTALLDLSETDEQFLSALELALNIVVATVVSIDEGEIPSHDRICELAEFFEQAGTWSDVSAQGVADLLSAIFGGRNPLEIMSPMEAATTTLALGGWLLAAFPMAEGSRWTDFLDAVLLGLEQKGAQ